MGGDTWENEEKASSLTWVALRQGWKPVKRLANLLQIEHVYYRGFCTFANHSECFFFLFLPLRYVMGLLHREERATLCGLCLVPEGKFPANH